MLDDDELLVVDELAVLANAAIAVDADTNGSTVTVVGVEVDVDGEEDAELVVEAGVLPLLAEVVEVVLELAVVDAVPEELLVLDDPLVPDDPLVLEDPLVPEEPLVLDEPLDPDEPLLFDPDVLAVLSADAMPDRIELRPTIDSRV